MCSISLLPTDRDGFVFYFHFHYSDSPLLPYKVFKCFIMVIVIIYNKNSHGVIKTVPTCMPQTFTAIVVII